MKDLHRSRLDVQNAKDDAYSCGVSWQQDQNILQLHPTISSGSPFVDEQAE
jgi:hypothetical protein